MSNKMDSMKSSARREKPQTLDGIQATKPLNEYCGSDSSIKSSDSGNRLARNRARGSEPQSQREHSADGVITTSDADSTKDVELCNEFEDSGASKRRDSLSYDDTSPSGQSSFSKSLQCRSIRLPSVVGGAATKKCVLTLDGYSYVIVASTPENLTHPTGNNLNTDCNTPQQTGSSINNITQPHLTSDKTAFKNIATATAIRTGTTLPASASAAANVSAAGGDSIGGEEDILNATYPSSVHNTPESICSNSSITNKSFASDINSQVARHGALTIVRRSNSRKSFSQYDTQHLYSAVTAPAPLSSADQNLLDDLKGQSSHDNRRNDTRLYSNTPLLNASAVSSVDNAATKICSSIKTTSTVTQNITKMLPTSPNSTNAAETADDTERTREDLLPCTASGSTIISSMANLTTDDLPAVDTPDACDKAALRLRSLLHMLNTGEIQADVLQKICIMQHES